ncbi:Phenylalanine racemase [Enterobacter sp. FY-07]|uniref:non-ribosomal peptide synthetase n=1 Tax=Kosakonia oryzendophytica TaxID=1005665 RepID=UPI00078B1BF5|nr:non-ribosomal peptide synthetase [Kosakonia oryzendophytica]AMO47207.1 Phenylalanine racemase [Enterobacter sp. FY-07]WBT58947.1 amino acid adenylation domain-containing protein [Kosakonia oryzendophytica]
MCISPTDIASARHLSPLNNSPLSPGECFPLSSAQQAIWLDQSLNPELTNYNIGCVVAIEGHIIPEIMSQAFEAIIKRHDAFQINLVNSDTPAQCFDSATPALLEYYDFSTVGNISQKIAQCISENFHNPFDLDKALWRSALIRSGENSWYWQFCCHHIIADGMSLSLINAELAYNYSQLIRKAMPLDDEAPSYADFITDDAAYLNSKQCVKDLEFWLERYAAHPPSLFQPLISAKKMAPLQSEPVNWVLDGELFQRIEQAAESQGLSVLHFMYAVFACYFKRTQDIEDIVLGIPLHNRRNARQKLAVGMYASVIPVRIKLTAEDTFAEIMHKAATELRYCYKHQRLPIAEIQRKTKIHQNTGRAHLFDMTLSYEPYVVDVHMEGAVVTSIKPHHRAQYPLAVTINRYAFTSNDKQNQSVIVEFNYSDAYFTTEDIVAIQSRLAVLLEGALQDLNTPVSCLPVLPDHERQQVLQAPHPLAGSRVNHLLIHEMFEAQVRQKPYAVAAVFDEKLMTYDELNRRANRLAHHLIALGVRPNDRVAIHLERGLEMVVGILGILKAGGAYVPLDPVYPGERLMYMLEDAAPVALVTQYSLANTLGKQIPTVMVDAPHSSSENIEDENNPDPALLGLATHHLAYVIYTSGSTGRPKGVMVEHRNVSRLLTTTQAHFHFTHNDRWTLCHSFSFDFSVWELFGALCSGGRLIVVPTACARSPHTLYALLCREQVTILNQTPSAFRQLIAAQDTTPHTLRCIIFGGEALEMHSLLPWVARESNRNTRLINMYGITEITVHATYYAIPLSDITPQGASLIGTPLADLRIYILDERGQPVPVGVTGELYIGGDGVARGYLNRPELTAERFLADPFAGGEGQRMYRTGDLGRWRADGNIEYLGRNDFQVKLRGFRIEPGETEAALVACDGVRDAVVTVREDTPGEKRLVAYLVAEPGHTLSPGVLRRQLSQTLAEYMLPAAWVTVAAFPLTANGKLDRRALPVPDSASVVTQGYEAPEGETERELAAVWCDLLGLERVGRHDNFFELGGHSLMMVSLLERLRRSGRVLDIRRAFAAPVLAGMARCVTAQDETDGDVPPSRIPAHCRAVTPAMLPLVTLSQAETDAVVATVSGGAANVQDIYPLSPLQEGILFHHLLEEEGDAYLLYSLLAFDSAARRTAFLGAFQQVIDRHDILRTAVCREGLSAPVQVVWRHATLPVTEFVPQGEAALPAQLRAHMDPRRRRIDLRRAPLFRAETAYDAAQQQWLLALSFHHLVCDHVTMGLICTEIAHILAGNGAALPAPQPYRNFIARTLRVPAAEHEAWFRAQLADVDTPTAPFGILNTRESGAETGEARLTTDTALTAAVVTQARRLGVSPGVLFHTALARVLAQLCGRDDVVFGTVLAGRLHAGGAGTPGMFINTLPLRLSLAGEGVRDAVLNTRSALAALLEHEQAPLSLALRCSGVPHPLPLFSTLLNYRHSPGEGGPEGLAGMTLLASEERTSYPVTFSVDETGAGFTLTAQTAAGIAPQRMAGYLLTAVSGLVSALESEPQRPLTDIPVLPADERRVLLEAFSGTRRDYPQASLIHRLFEAQVRRTPEAVAVVCEGASLSYDALNRRANRLAHRLMALGVRPDARVAVCMARSAETVVALLGILKAGGAYLPLDPASPAGRLERMLADAEPVALVSVSGQGVPPGCAVPQVWLDTLAADGEAETECNPSPEGLTSRHLAYVIYTSGSTGQPKGVMVEHRSVINLHSALKSRLGLPQPCRVTMNASIVFDASVQCWLQLLSGHTLIIVPEAVRKDSGAFLQFLLRHDVDVVDCTPVQLQGLLEAGLGDMRNPQPRWVLVGGDAISSSTWTTLQTIKQIRFFNVYGPTECTVDATICLIDNCLALPVIGQPLANTRIYILDERGQPVPVGVTGELYIGGDGVARGYLNRPELTAERFLADPFAGGEGQRMYRTGDLGRWRADGNIEYLGRNDFQVKLRGFRIEPGETEAALVACDGVRDAVVTVREDTPGEKRLVAYLVAEPGHTLSPGVLRRQLSQTLAEYMLPAAWVTVAAFPLTANGKLDRRALPVPDSASVVTQGYEAPEGETERELAAVWCDLLGLERVGRHDNFFELGGHSLMAVQLLNRLARAGMETSLAILFAHPILRQLAVAVKRPGKLTTSPLDDNPLLLRAEGTQPPLFFVHEPSGDPLVYSPLASLLQVDRPVYVLHALGMYALENPPTSLEALAAYHAEVIRRVQPHGPYYLCGWSLGGLLSYEIACQLHQRGEEIAFIGMIDSYHPALLQNSAFDALSAAEQRDAMILTFLSNYVPESDRAVLAQLQRPIDEKKAVDLCSFHRWLPDDMTCEALLLRLNTALYIRPLGLKYRPSSSDFTVNLYTAETQENEDRWRGWHGIVGERSSLHPVGGTHHSIMQQPRLAQLAAYLSAHLLPQTPYNPVVIMHEGVKTEPPLFCIPGAGASAFSFLDLAGLLPVSSPVYVLQARGLTEVTRMPHLTVEETARDYIYAMRQIQPCGPYFVVGHSFGGWIALEIALQLQAQGESVSDLIVIDSRAPGSKQSASHREAIMKLIDIYNLMLNRTLPVTWEELSPLAPKEQLGYLHQVLVDAGLYTNKTPLSALEGVFQVIKANLNTSYYPATRYRGVMHMINAQEGDCVAREKHNAVWSAYAERLTPLLNPGNHMTMLTMPFVAKLADYITTVMSQTRD